MRNLQSKPFSFLFLSVICTILLKQYIIYLFQAVLDRCMTTSGHDSKDKDFYVSLELIHADRSA